MAVIEVTDSSFKAEVLDSSKPVLVDFWAPWCGPCRMVGPVVEAISESLADKLKTVKINTDENQQTAMDFQITGIPCLIVVKGGKEVARSVGYKPQAALEAEIAAHL